MALPQSELLLTIDEYLSVERESEERHEYLDGFVYAMAGKSEEHGIITTNLTVAIGTQLRGGPCAAFSKDLKVRSGPLPASPRSLKGFFSYPDLVVVCGERQYHDQYRDVLLNPSLIIEVLSESTRNFDRSEKFVRYRTWLPSLTDYLLVEQMEPLLEHHIRQSENVWQMTVFRGLDQEVFISSINCRLLLTEVYDRITFPVSDESGESVSDEAPQ